MCTYIHIYIYIYTYIHIYIYIYIYIHILVYIILYYIVVYHIILYCIILYHREDLIYHCVYLMALRSTLRPPSRTDLPAQAWATARGALPPPRRLGDARHGLRLSRPARVGERGSAPKVGRHSTKNTSVLREARLLFVEP